MTSTQLFAPVTGIHAAAVVALVVGLAAGLVWLAAGRKRDREKVRELGFDLYSDEEHG